MGKTSVLIVEDDADISGIVAEHAWGARGTRARRRSRARRRGSCWKAAAARGERVRRGGVRPHAAGLPGEDIVRLVRAADAATPIIVTSARSAAVGQGRTCSKLGADDYLAKPFDLDELLARIEVQLRHRGRTGRAAAWRRRIARGDVGARPRARAR